MKTGEPGSNAAVTNSGTDQNAILDFVIPGGGGTSPDLMAAYSTPPQPGTSGQTLLFDKNGLSYGSSISHTEGSGDFTINSPGVYSVAFHGTVAAGSGSTFPSNINLFLQQNGSPVAGANVQHTFQSSTESVNQAFTVPIQVSSAPSTLNIVGQGGDFVYSGPSMSIYRIGNIPSETQQS